MLDKYPDRVNLVLKHYPLSKHKAAKPAALAALAAANQGKYKEMSAVLFKNYRSLNNASIKQYAQQLGLDMAVYEKDIQSPLIQKMVSQDTRAARRFRVRGVPAIFINGKRAKSRSPEGFERLIQKELHKAE